MEDSKIVQLYWERSETALSETQQKYHAYCHAIAYRILESREDAEECVNDTWARAWQAIPPQRPERLAPFLGKITRNLALDCYSARTAAKRGGGQTALALEELAECLPAGGSVEETADAHALEEALARFVRGLPAATRPLFVHRYWHLCSIADIAAESELNESTVKMRLLRTRRQLQKFLEKEGFSV